MKLTTSLSSLVLAAGAVSLPASAATLLTFDTDGEFAANFTPETGAPQADRVAQAAGVGIGGSGGLLTTGTSGNTAFQFFSAVSGDATAAGEIITASIDFRFDARSGGSGNFDAITLGLLPNFDANASGVSLQVLGNSSGALNDIQLNFGGGVLSTQFTPVDGNWYRLNYSSEDNGSNTIRTASVDLLDGTTGAVVTAGLTSGSRSLASGLETDTEFVGFRAFDSFGGGTQALDNFGTSLVIPEPGSLSLAVLGLLAMCTRRRSK